MSSSYGAIRVAAEHQQDTDRRIEVNQRALIDKILARYAAKHAVYRELLQNSDDAGASVAEIRFTCKESVAEQVVYRNNGEIFRTQDWDRLQKIAEGNPDVSKVGAFGVGAYTMFSVAEEPLVISGKQALLFKWKEDALWTRIVQQDTVDEWTSFVLDMRDPRPLPDMVSFGSFLCKSLTFTDSLREIRVYVNEQMHLTISKNEVMKPTALQAKEKPIFESPEGIFSLEASSLFKSTYEISVQLDHQVASIQAYCISARARTSIPVDMERQMERVTKKLSPEEVTVKVLHATFQNKATGNKSKATRIARSFVPAQPGSGRIFIGFSTSQTTGLAAHVGAPFYPTVEREAMDLQDPSLRQYNLELLELCGVVLRLSMEQSMAALGQKWLENAATRERLLAASNKVKEEKELTGLAQSNAAILTVGEVAQQSLLVSDDTAPLAEEERLAVLLMKSFCPRKSTPEVLVGTTVVRAFTACLPHQAPPVLTRTGVIPGNKAKVPMYGMDKFVSDCVVRPAIYKSTKEFHDQVAGCGQLQISDLATLLDSTVLDEDEVVLLLEWWREYFSDFSFTFSALDSLSFLEGIHFRIDTEEGKAVHKLKLYTHYCTLDLDKKLPLPATVLPRCIQDRAGESVMRKASLVGLWRALTMEEWVAYISKQRCMYAGNVEDFDLREKVLVTMSQAHSMLPKHEQDCFGLYCERVFENVECIPFDAHSKGERAIAVARPSHLFLRSTIVKLKHFNVVSKTLRRAGVSEQFLRAIGVRSTVSVKLLLAQSEDFGWRNDPKTLFEYLSTLDLSVGDMLDLTHYRYLTAENDDSRLFAPSELCLPCSESRIFPSVKMLKWPLDDDIGQFKHRSVVWLLKRVGVRPHPPVLQMLKHIAHEVKDDEERMRYLNVIRARLSGALSGGGLYNEEYLQGFAVARDLQFLPCVTERLLVSDESFKVINSPGDSYLDKRCAALGFCVIDPELGVEGRKLGKLFKCDEEPKLCYIIKKFEEIVASAKIMTSSAEHVDRIERSNRVVITFGRIFQYLSLRIFELSRAKIQRYMALPIIPVRVGESVKWICSKQAFFKGHSTDTLVTSLFYAVDPSPFLDAIGVKKQPTTLDIYRMVLAAPKLVLRKLGSHDEYLSMLRLFAANHNLNSFRKVGGRDWDTSFLLAYTTTKNSNGSPGQVEYKLAKPNEIYVVDNSLLARMFNVPSAPQEFDLEVFYASLGSPYLSNEVKKKFQVESATNDTPCTQALRTVINERCPLLVSPSTTSRPLVENAVSLLDENELDIVQADSIAVIYSMGGLLKKIHRKETTCCVKPHSSTNDTRNTLYVTEDFDWFDVGSAIGELILQRCHVEDAFFVGSLLETPLQLLRKRGFPVDQVIVRQKAVHETTKSSTISDSLFSAARSAAAQVATIGAAQQQAMFGDGSGEESSSWLFAATTVTSPLSLLRSVVDSRTIFAPEGEASLAEPLLSPEAAGTALTSQEALPPNNGQASTTPLTPAVTSDTDCETTKEMKSIPLLVETEDEAAAKSRHEEEKEEVEEEHVEQGAMSYILDWL